MITDMLVKRQTDLAKQAELTKLNPNQEDWEVIKVCIRILQLKKKTDTHLLLTGNNDNPATRVYSYRVIERIQVSNAGWIVSDYWRPP